MNCWLNKLSVDMDICHILHDLNTKNCNCRNVKNVFCFGKLNFIVFHRMPENVSANLQKLKTYSILCWNLIKMTSHWSFFLFSEHTYFLSLSLPLLFLPPLPIVLLASSLIGTRLLIVELRCMETARNIIRSSANPLISFIWQHRGI